MDATQTLPLDKPQAKRAVSPNRTRLLYAGAAVLLVVLMLLGFQQFYLHGKAFPNRPLTPPIRTLLVLHGVAMTGWMVLFLVQPMLIVSGKRRVHMALGRVGGGLAAAVVLLGLLVGVRAAQVNPPDLKLWGLVPKQFVAIPVFSILLFGLFVSIGLWFRRRPDVHRPMMLLGTMAAIPAAIDRIGAIRNLYSGTVFGAIFGPFFGMLVIGLAFLIVKRLLTRTWDKWYATGYAGLAAASALIMLLARSTEWSHLTHYVLG